MRKDEYLQLVGCLGTSPWGTRAPQTLSSPLLLSATFVSWRINISIALGATHSLSLPSSWVMLPLKKVPKVLRRALPFRRQQHTR